MGKKSYKTIKKAASAFCYYFIFKLLSITLNQMPIIENNIL